jgi:glycerol-3-phosphate dehydrogenase (NAD+)
VAKIVGLNVQAHPKLFESNVAMWVYEEEVNGEKLTEIINTRHENVKCVISFLYRCGIHVNLGFF